MLGWQIAGVIGAAYGYFFSRIFLVAQDLYTIRLIHAGGWLARGTWIQIGTQVLVAAIFSLAYYALPSNSYWFLLPAAVHGSLMAVWLLREPLRRRLARSNRLAQDASTL